MKNHDQTIHGVSATYYISWWAGVEGPFSDTRQVARSYLTSSSVKGDHKKPNPFSFTKQYQVYLEGQFDHVSNYTYRRVGAMGQWVESINNVNVGFSVPTPSSDELSSLRNRAVSRFYSKLKSSDVNSLVTLGESKESLGLRKQAMASAKKLFAMAYKTAKAKKGIPGLTKAVGGAYLFYTFGIRPLINDIKAYQDFVAAEYVVKPMSIHASASERRTTVIKPYSFASHTEYFVMKHKFGALLRIKDYESFDQWRLGLKSPISSAYALVPFSFVLDWVYDVGTWLQTIEDSYLTSVELISGYETRTWKTGIVCVWRGPHVQQYGTTFWDATGRGSAAHCTRTLLTSLPSQAKPSFRLDLSSGQILSGLALLSQFLIKG